MVVRSNFILKSVKKIGGGSVDLEFKVIEPDSGSTHENEFSLKSTHVIHPDFSNALEELNDHYVKAKGYDIVHQLGRLELTSAQQKKVKSVEKLLAKINENNYNLMEASSMSLQHKDGQIASVVIKGTQEHADGKKVGSATTKIELSKNAFGVEEELIDLCERITDEAYEFIYEHKRSQIEIDFDEGENPEAATGT